METNFLDGTNGVWKVLSNKYTIIIYISVLMLLIILLIGYLISNETLKERYIASPELFNFKSKKENVIIKSNQNPDKKNEKKEAKPELDKTKSRFFMLKRIDQNLNLRNEKFSNNNITLKEFCIRFRNYAASVLNLYYSIEDIMRFISGLGVSKIIILEGMSGTGKTSLAYAFGQFVSNESTIIPVQPMWKERTDLIGYYNEFTKKFNETDLLIKLYEANISKKIYLTVLDEMNIARVEYYFAEFLSLLELPNQESRNLDVVSDVWESDPKVLKDGKLNLASNMYFIGTANNDDSTFAISDKVYDRAMVLSLDEKSVPFEAEYTKNISISNDRLQMLYKEAIESYKISKRNLKRLKMLDKYLIDNFHITFGNRIMKQIKNFIPIYIACGGDELEGLDYLLARKVIRHLSGQNPIYLRSEAPRLISFIDELFGENKLKYSISEIEKIKRNA